MPGRVFDARGPARLVDKPRDPEGRRVCSECLHDHPDYDGPWSFGEYKTPDGEQALENVDEFELRETGDGIQSREIGKESEWKPYSGGPVYCRGPACYPGLRVYDPRTGEAGEL